MEIPRENFNQKIETNNGTAIISIPENASVDDLLYVKEMLDLVIKRHFHIELKWHLRSKAWHIKKNTVCIGIAAGTEEPLVGIGGINGLEKPVLMMTDARNTELAKTAME